MLHPAALGIRPQYIAEYIEKIASAVPLERVWMCCHGLELNTNVSVKPRITLVKGSDMVDGIRRRVPPFPLRPPLNWLQSCSDEMDACEIPALSGRSKPGEMEWSGSQPRKLGDKVLPFDYSQK